MANQTELLVGALIGAVLGGAAISLMNQKGGKKGKGKHHGIRENVEEWLQSIGDNEWTNKAKEHLQHLKEQAESFELADHKELGIGLLIGALLGGLGTVLTHDKLGSNDSWKPILSEFRRWIKEEENDSNEPTKVNNIVDFAVSGLKLWNKIKK